MIGEFTLGVEAMTLVLAQGATGADLREPVAPKLPDLAPVADIVAGAPADSVDTPMRAGAAAATIGAVRIEGNDAIARDALMPVVEPFLGRAADGDTLRALAQAVAADARARGYLFASAMVPDQSVPTGVVTVRLSEGRIDRVRVTGTDDARARRILARLEGRTPSRVEVERALLLAGDLPGLTIEATRFVREGDAAILDVTVVEDDWRGLLGLDNNGPKAFGPVRARAGLDAANLVTRGDEFELDVLQSVVRPRELTYLSGRYTLTLDDAGTSVGVGGALGRSDSGLSSARTGRSRYATVFATAPVLRRNRASLWVSGSLGYLRVDDLRGSLLDGRDTIATAVLTLSGAARPGRSRVAGGVSIVQGLGLAGTTRRGDPAASRGDASGEFTRATMWGDWTRDLFAGLSLRVAVNAQLASRPLLSSQEIDLGGPRFGRAYDYSERFGDRGVLGSVELRRMIRRPLKPIDWMQPYAFVDGGAIGNIGPDGFGGGRRFSAGGGVRAWIGRAELTAELAAPLTRSPVDRSPRANLALGFRF